MNVFIKNKNLYIIAFLLFVTSHSYSKTVYVATTGSDLNTGTFALPYLTITKAVSSVTAGDTILVRGGTYTLLTTISISKNGNSSSKYHLLAYSNERPVLDFSGMSATSGNRGINLSGSYWIVKGVDIRGAGDNGMNVSGGNNTIEFCSFYRNRDSGLQLSGGASNNQIVNCDSYFNKDADEGNADGFAVKLDVGTGNYFYGCRVWQNSDDGWDGYLRPSDDITTTLENCWCFMNGYREDGSVSTGNGNGFKLGGSDLKTLRHNFILKNCVAFDNRVKGFDQNNNRGSMTLLNCTAYRNGTNYSFVLALDSASNKVLTIKNSIAIGSYGTVSIPSVQQTNSWIPPFTVTADDFLSLDTTGVRGTRSITGSLPEMSFLHLAPGSDLIDSGTDVGLPYNGTAPDLGAFEYTVPATLPVIATAAISAITQTTATGGGTISSDGGALVTARGVCWNTLGAPSISDQHTADSSGPGVFTSSLTGLSAGTLYYVRAYAVNSSGIAYGSLVSFTTLSAELPTVSTSAVSNISQNTASYGGVVASDGGAAITARGVCWSESTNPTTADAHSLDGSGTGVFISALNGLVLGTRYFVRAYAVNSIGTAYGAVDSFTTLGAVLPTVVTSAISAITQTSAASGGTISADGGATVSARGVCWNATGTPTIAGSHSTDGTGTGVFTSQITTLLPGVTYYVRAYAINSTGTAYGAEVSFVTLTGSQNDSVRWALTANQAYTVTSHLTGVNQTLSSGGGVLSMNVKDYSAGGTNGGQRCNLGTTSWPNESGQNDGRYIEFTVSPVSGYYFNATGLSFDIGYSSTTAHMFSNLYYSTDGWLHRTKINTDSIVSLNSAWNNPAPSFPFTVQIAPGTSLSIRLYPWYNTSPSTTKYLSLRNFVIKGNTTPAVQPAAVCNLKLALQGLYNGTGHNAQDTCTVYLAESITPYGFVDSVKIVIDSLALTGSASFQNISTGNYFIVVKHKSAIETWSAAAQTITRGATTVYDFTTSQDKAYGSNQIFVGQVWCLYNGDADQNGFIDFSDLTLIDNDAYIFSSGYLPTDIDGNLFVDFSDLTICDNNAYNFVGVVKPTGATRASSKNTSVLMRGFVK